LLDETSPTPNAVAAVDSLLLLRGPFPVVSMAGWLDLGSDGNTRVIVFVLNLPDQSPSVTVNLVDSNNKSYEVPAEDVRPVPNTNFTQIVFRLPSTLPDGVCTVRVSALGHTTNAGVIMIRI
jgi:chemotaxis signal transduction protein